MRIESDDFVNGSWVHYPDADGTVAQWREDNIDDEDTLEALDKLEKGEIDEFILGGGAAQMIRLRAVRIGVRLTYLSGSVWLRALQYRSFDTTTEPDERLAFASPDDAWAAAVRVTEIGDVGLMRAEVDELS